ncbi:4Fe-4S cluster-binding domain-containing protein [Candidatus Bipolaricaulota bacterium]|nr:4Fe-4S cluster-binding domain-containing protein [Candidatus Bipolaricaulota bacterium]HBR09778.1 radical SAM protein [Candidatus Acetothermia bacterium]
MRLTAAMIADRAARLEKVLSLCTLCHHRCLVDRRKGEVGRCGLGNRIKVANFGPHFGEERPLVGRRGSGTVFFSGCNLACLFCQNYDISQLQQGEELKTEDLAAIFFSLAQYGCHNINLVTPTHQAPQLLFSLAMARDQGLDLPVVWNCGGYESVESLQELEGIVDIYMPDVKYGDDRAATQYSDAPQYFTNIKAVLQEMHRQVGDLVIENGVAQRGLLIRHLVLPNQVAASQNVLQFIAAKIGCSTYINIMSQYCPSYRAKRCPQLARPITIAEYTEVVAIANALGLRRGLSLLS